MCDWDGILCDDGGGIFCKEYVGECYNEGWYFQIIDGCVYGCVKCCCDDKCDGKGCEWVDICLVDQYGNEYVGEVNDCVDGQIDIV